jgi:hypothetical protein
MNRGTLLRPLVGVAALAAGVGFSATPAAARTCTVTAIVQGGRQVTVTVDIPPGTPVEEVELPGVHVPVVSIVSTTCALKTPTPSPTPKPKETPTPDPAETPAADPKGSERQQSSSRGQEKAPSKKADEETEKKAEPNRADRAGKAKPPKPDKDESADQAPTKNGNRAPTPDDPGYTLANPAPARIGVPNFVIDKFRIPPFLLPIYQAAGIQYGVRWEVIAAINEIETDYGRNLNISSAGAMGWMQFIRSSWKTYGVDGNEDGLQDPYNPVDAIFAAARYLRAAGADKDLRRAIFAYNHADWYVDSVLMRANVIGGLPSNLVGSLTGLTQGRFPVYAKASYANDLTARDVRRHKTRGNAARVVEGRRNRTGIEVFARRGAPVVAVNDGRITAIGRNTRLGRYVQLQDVYGNTYTYAHLGKVAEAYPKPKTRTVTPEQVAREMKLPPPDPKPADPASAATKGGRTGKATPAASAASLGLPPRPKRSLKERLFANPDRPRARAAGGAEQLLENDTTEFASYYTPVLGLEPADVDMRRLRPGARVATGTILGRIGKTAGRLAPHVRFEIRPAGRGAPRIDPKPILDGWQLLETTEVYRAANRNPFFGKGADAPTIGQILLMSKDQLSQRVLADPRVDIYGCGRQDVRTGQIDRRVLATLEFLVSSGFKPTVTSLKCGHGFYTASGNVSNHSSGNAVDIAAVNGIPILGHQGKGSITDIVVQRLLTLQGTLRPDEIITLMDYEGAPNAFALGDHDDHIHVGWRPVNGLPLLRRGRKPDDSTMKPGQWTRLIDRLGAIPNPMVAPTPSKYAVKVD